MSIKKFIYTAAASIVALPVAAEAQFETPAGTGLPAGSVIGIITNGMNYLLIIVGILGVVGFVISGIIYLTAAGDEDQIERGKRTMINSIIGIVVALIGIVVMQFVKGALSGTSKSF